MPPKTVTYRFCKNFNEQKFVYQLHQKLIQGDINETDNSYSKLTEVFSEVLEKHVAKKSQLVRGTQVTFYE